MLCSLLRPAFSGWARGRQPLISKEPFASGFHKKKNLLGAANICCHVKWGKDAFIQKKDTYAY